MMSSSATSFDPARFAPTCDAPDVAIRFGRYTQSDPIGLEGGANLFAYVDAQPVNARDILGLKAIVRDQFPRRNDATVVCDGKGNVTPFIGDDYYPTHLQFECMIDCTLLHEHAHKNWIDMHYPNICKGKRAGLLVGFSNDEKGRREIYETERQAYLIIIRCLGNAKRCKGDRCANVLEDAINYYADLLLRGDITDMR